MERVKALVTGGAGFIGSHLVDQLLREGLQVTVIDNLSAGNFGTIKQHEGNKDFLFIQEDVSHFDRIEPYFKGVDWVFHLAALADIVPSIDDPLKYFKSNVDGTVATLEAARLNHIKRFIYAASGSCYGIATQLPTPEVAPIRTEYPYALTKYLGECSALHWSKVYGLPLISLRFSNVYGPRSRTTGAYGAVFGVFLAQKIHKLPFTVVGDGEQTRDFVYVTDIVGALIAAAQSKLSSEIFNVGSGNTYKINYLVKLLGGDKVYLPKRPGEPDSTFMDISKIQKHLHWSPQIPFEEGVQKMLENLSLWEKAPLWTPEAIEKSTLNWFKYLKST